VKEAAKHLTQIVGGFSIFLAVIFIFLACMWKNPANYPENLRPVFFFLTCYWLVTGLGLLRFKRWAALLLVLPGIVTLCIFIVAWRNGAAAAMPWALLDYAFVATEFFIPLLILRQWHHLRW